MCYSNCSFILIRKYCITGSGGQYSRRSPQVIGDGIFQSYKCGDASYFDAWQRGRRVLSPFCVRSHCLRLTKAHYFIYSSLSTQNRTLKDELHIWFRLLDTLTNWLLYDVWLRPEQISLNVKAKLLTMTRGSFNPLFSKLNAKWTPSGCCKRQHNGRLPFGGQQI